MWRTGKHHPQSDQIDSGELAVDTYLKKGPSDRCLGASA